MTPDDEIQQLRAKLQVMRNEAGKANASAADLARRNREKHTDIIAMREAMTEIRELLHSGQIREALAVIDNEQAIYMAKREPRKVMAA